MPDEHREVLHVILDFLHTIAQHSSINQMNESNLALCFAPTLIHQNQVTNRHASGGAPYPKELDENRAAHDCLLFLVQNYDNLYCVSIFQESIHDFIYFFEGNTDHIIFSPLIKFEMYLVRILITTQNIYNYNFVTLNVTNRYRFPGNC